MTKLEYLQKLPLMWNGIELRKLALQNYSATFSKRFKAENLHDAICIGIQWYNTPQGFKFWEGIAIAADKGELKIEERDLFNGS